MRSRIGKRSVTGAVTAASRVLTDDIPRVASGVAVEAGWLAAHFVMYPLGALRGPRSLQVERHDLEGLSPEQRGLVHAGVEVAATPILLVHGIIDNHAIFTVLDRDLRRRGFRTISAYDYGLFTNDVPAAAELLGDAIEKVAANTGYERIHVIGHSLGGLMARYYVQRLGGDAHVHTLVTLGTPHAGTRLAQAFPLARLVRQLTPESPVIRELAEPAAGCRTRFVAFYSDIDHLIVPSRNARLDHPDLDVRNVAVRGVGHLSMPSNGGIAHTIAAVLRELDPDGTQTEAGPA
jgi:pimeloyl-ACP methyl ester carboxylesterase